MQNDLKLNTDKSRITFISHNKKGPKRIALGPTTTKKSAAKKKKKRGDLTQKKRKRKWQVTINASHMGTK